MSIEERKCNGDVHSEDFSSDVLITYKRRKRLRPSGTGSSAAGGEVSHFASSKGKKRDIGWEHGEIVNGNRLHWRCNWCGMVRSSGGVSRLKKHLAGGWQVRRCLEVPYHIKVAMKKHLLEMEKKTISRYRRKARDYVVEKNSVCLHPDEIVDKDHGQLDLEMQVNQQVMRGLKISRTSSQELRKAYRRSRAATQHSKADMAKAMKIPHDTMLCTSTYEPDAPSSLDSHWRNILENMLQLPEVSDSGVQSCIRDALKSGPPGFTREINMVDVPKDSIEAKDSHKGHWEVQDQSLRPDISVNATLDASQTGTNGQTDIHVNTMKCQNVFLDILRSEKFVSLCNLLSGSLYAKKAEKLFDFSLIDLKMKNGDYEHSPRLFDQDIQQVWKKFQKIGQEMVFLASSLSNMSWTSYQKLVGEDLVHEADEQKFEDNCQVVAEQRNSNDPYTMTQFPCESDRSTKPDQTEASGLYKVCMCKHCGAEADGEQSLICDECEAVYHFSCAKPAIQSIPTTSWYCASCIKDRSNSPEPFAANIQQDGLHQNCVVCDRLEIPEAQKTLMANDSREGSVSSMESEESEEPPEPSRTALERLCKQCGTCEDEDKRFLTCGNRHCTYVFYHIRCLKSSQLASLQQQNNRCWYCPSCLCRACLCDKDDDKIALCDGCDEAYHIYCMKPPRTSIPEGQWYCVHCNVARAREGMRRYEKWILEKHGKKDIVKGGDANRSMDMLLSAVEKVSSEERLEVGKKVK